MMKKLTALFVASTLALGAVNLAHAADTTSKTTTDAAQPNGTMMHHHKGKMGPRNDMMFQGLNLTDAQKQRIRDIRKDSRQNMKR
ncbi:ATP-independent periplasmic protein-refolding chaperone, partial [Klebsiella pneumoniae]|uniref:Spy/CpxP family protein refolding chaperone n=1 Tax=Klebsiella pneumoniae TaxID=573 RepID=UPI000F982E1B